MGFDVFVVRCLEQHEVAQSRAQMTISQEFYLALFLSTVLVVLSLFNQVINNSINSFHVKKSHTLDYRMAFVTKSRLEAQIRS